MAESRSVEIVFSTKDGNACGYDFGNFGVTLYYLVEDAFGPLGIQFNPYAGEQYEKGFKQWIETRRVEDQMANYQKWSFAIVDVADNLVEEIQQATQRGEDEPWHRDELMGQVFQNAFPNFPK